MSNTEQGVLKELWLKRIQDWKSSGKQIAEWCRENGVHSRSFYHWRIKLNLSPTQNSNKQTSFIELEDETSISSGISISYKGITVQLAKNFDENALNKCLKILSESC